MIPLSAFFAVPKKTQTNQKNPTKLDEFILFIQLADPQ